MYIEVIRTYKEAVTLGRFIVRGNQNEVVKEFASIELPDKANQSSISCIPEGIYEVEVLRNSPAIKYEHLSIINVPNRSGIKIHVANYVSELRGCIAIGAKHIDLNNDGIIDVTASTPALKELLSIVHRFGFNSDNKKRFQIFIKQ